MSQENVEIVRRIYEQEMFGRDPGRLLDLATPDIEYVNPPYAIEPGIRRGRAEVAQAVKNANDFFESPRYVLSELFDAGDSVVVALTIYARAHGTETEIVQEECHTWTLREGRIARFEWGRDLRAALEAVGGQTP
jgi:ketosteroid isomerase-like protein